MSEETLRLGDMIDDYCPRCRLVLNHDVASLVGTKVVKVICRTCHTEHAYRHGEVGAKKPAGGRATLFDQVLSRAAPSAPSPTTPTTRKKSSIPPRSIARRKTKPPSRKD